MSIGANLIGLLQLEGLNIDLAATNVVNALTSMFLEMEEAMRALGRSALNELSPDDLVALDSLTAEVTGVKRVY